MIKYISVTFFILFLSTSCEKEQTNRPFVSRSVGVIVDALEDAYSHKSESKYLDILNEWNNNISLKPFDSIDSGIERDVYRIFQVFYNPFDISRLGEHEWGELYEGYRFAIVQNYVYYNYSFENENYEERDSIGDFRPEIHLDGKTILYLTPDYHEAIYTFLGAEYNPLGTGGIMNPASPTGESKERLDFLQTCLAIIPGHWGGYYHIETHPYVSFIAFNENADKARLSFRAGYMFGEADFEKNRNNWVMTHSAITGIEK